MIVEIRQPETEALIEQRMASGSFNDIEAVLLYALRTAPPPPSALARNSRGMNLVEVCALVRGLTDDVDFSRDPSPGREVELV